MAAHPPCQADIRHHGGVELLVRFLHERPLSLAGRAELAACERVQQKAAIALSRLCHSGASTEKIIHTKGELWCVVKKFKYKIKKKKEEERDGYNKWVSFARALKLKLENFILQGL